MPKKAVWQTWNSIFAQKNVIPKKLSAKNLAYLSVQCGLHKFGETGPVEDKRRSGGSKKSIYSIHFLDMTHIF